jgi:hypothetical protein
VLAEMKGSIKWEVEDGVILSATKTQVTKRSSVIVMSIFSLFDINTCMYVWFLFSFISSFLT